MTEEASVISTPNGVPAGERKRLLALSPPFPTEEESVVLGPEDDQDDWSKGYDVGYEAGLNAKGGSPSPHSETP